MVVYLSSFKNGQAECERKPNTINRTKSAVKSFFTWAWELDYIERNLAKTVKVKRVGRRIPDYLTLLEQQKLLEIISTAQNRHYYRDQVLFTLFLETGLRLSEVLNLNIGDINLTERYLLVHHSKGGVEMKKTLPDTLCGVLQEYLTFRGAFTAATDALFISSQNTRISKGQVSRLLKHYLHKAGIGKSVSIHSLRHSFAMTVYEATKNIMLVKQALGHRSIMTSAVYLR